jgi:hypothetical protein
VDQVSQFDEYLASHPAGANWNSTNSLFAFWIGINDLVRCYSALMGAFTNDGVFSIRETPLVGYVCKTWCYAFLVTSI